MAELFFYTKALCLPQPFALARDGLTNLLAPVLRSAEPKSPDVPPSCKLLFLRVHALLFTRDAGDALALDLDLFLAQLGDAIAAAAKTWLPTGYQMAVANCNALMDYGCPDSAVFRAISDGAAARPDGDDQPTPQPQPPPAAAVHLFSRMLGVVLARVFHKDFNGYSYMHTAMVFVLRVVQCPPAMELLGHKFPWMALSDALNQVQLSYDELKPAARDGGCRPAARARARRLARAVAARILAAAAPRGPGHARAPLCRRLPPRRLSRRHPCRR